MECSEQESENSAWPKLVTSSFSLVLSHFMSISFFTNEKRKLSNTFWGPCSSKVLWLIYLQPKRCLESGWYVINIWWLWTMFDFQMQSNTCIWKYCGISIFIIWEADWFGSNVIKIHEFCLLRSKRNCCYLKAIRECLCGSIG